MLTPLSGLSGFIHVVHGGDAIFAGRSLWTHVDKGLRVGSGGLAVLEAPAFVAGLDDVAVMRETIEKGRGHLGVPEDSGPLAEGEIGGDDDRGALVEPADKVEEQLAAGLGEGKIAELVEDGEVEPGQVIGAAALVARATLGLELVD